MRSSVFPFVGRLDLRREGGEVGGQRPVVSEAGKDLRERRLGCGARERAEGPVEILDGSCFGLVVGNATAEMLREEGEDLGETESGLGLRAEASPHFVVESLEAAVAEPGQVVPEPPPFPEDGSARAAESPAAPAAGSAPGAGELAGQAGKAP